MSLFIELFIASSIPVVKILLICSIGAICARKGLLTPEGRRVLGALAFLVFNPSLIFVKLAGTLTPARLLHWWPLIVNTAISTLVGLGLGHLGARLVRPPEALRPHTVVAIALGNLGNLPLVIVSTLASSAGRLLAGMAPEQAEDLAVSYVVVGLIVPVVVHATIGFSMLRKPNTLPLVEHGGEPAAPGGSCPETPRGAAVAALAAAAAAARPHTAQPGKDAQLAVAPMAESAAADVELAEHSGRHNRMARRLGSERGKGSGGGGPWLEHDERHHDRSPLLEPTAKADAEGGGCRGGDGGCEPDDGAQSCGDGGAGSSSANACSCPGSGGTHAPCLRCSKRVTWALPSGGRSGQGPGASSWEGSGSGCRSAGGVGLESAVAVGGAPGAGWRHSHGGEHGPCRPPCAGGCPEASSHPKPQPGRPAGRQGYDSLPSMQRAWEEGGASRSCQDPWEAGHAPDEARGAASWLPRLAGAKLVRSGGEGEALLRSASGKRTLAALVPSASGRRTLLAWPAALDWRAVGRQLLREAVSPPLLTVLLSVPVGCIGPLQRALFGPGAPLALLTDSLRMLGDCTIPSILLILGATLAHGPGAARVPLRVTALVTAMRLALLPLLGVGLVMGAYALRVFPAPDPVYLLVLLIQNTAPTAIMVHTMASVQGNRPEETSAILFWGYMVGILAVPLWCTLFLAMIQAQYRG